jgi:hypothetical protein
MSFWWLGVPVAVMAVRKVFPEATVILGGAYPDRARHHAKRFSGAGQIADDGVTVAATACLPAMDLYEGRIASVARVDDYLAALVEALRARRLTTLALKDTAALITTDLGVARDTLSVLAESIVVLQQVTYRDQLHRVLSVPKMRFSAHELRLREFTIAAPEGISVHTPSESDAGVLAAITRPQAGPAAARGDVDRPWP